MIESPSGFSNHTLEIVHAVLKLMEVKELRIKVKSSKHHPDRNFKVYNQDGSWFITVYPGAYRLIFANPTAYLEGTDKQILCSGSDVTEGVLLVKPGRVVQKDGKFCTDPNNLLRVMLCPDADKADEYNDGSYEKVTYNDYLVAKEAEKREEAEAQQPQSVQQPVEQQPEQVVVEPGSVIEFDVDGQDARVVGNAQDTTVESPDEPEEILFVENNEDEQEPVEPKQKKNSFARIKELLGLGKKQNEENSQNIDEEVEVIPTATENANPEEVISVDPDPVIIDTGNVERNPYNTDAAENEDDSKSAEARGKSDSDKKFNVSKKAVIIGLATAAVVALAIALIASGGKQHDDNADENDKEQPVVVDPVPGGKPRHRDGATITPVPPKPRHRDGATVTSVPPKPRHRNPALMIVSGRGYGD